MSVITIRFLGICCFIDGRERDPFVKRVILPRDSHCKSRGDEPHIPHLQIDAADVQQRNGIAVKDTFKSGSRDCQRIDVCGERISIRNAAQGDGRLVVLPTFRERIPHMTLVCPDCPPYPRPECFVDVPPSDLVAAYFDLHSGFLSAGAIEEEETRFDHGSNWPTRRLAHWAEVDLMYHGNHAELVLDKFDGSGSRSILLKRDTPFITIANQPESDIVARDATADRRMHFDMYYELGAGLPDKRPRPANAKGVVLGCAPTNWP